MKVSALLGAACSLTLVDMGAASAQTGGGTASPPSQAATQGTTAQATETKAVADTTAQAGAVLERQSNKRDQIQSLLLKAANGKKPNSTENYAYTDSERLSFMTQAMQLLTNDQRESGLTTEKLRFRAALTTILTMRQGTGKLGTMFAFGQQLNDFQVALNPTLDPYFREKINMLREKVGGKGNAGLGIGAGLLRNPWISAAWSVASVFLSNQGRDDKQKQLNEILGMLDVVMVTDAPNRVLISRLSSLLRRIDQFEKKVEDAFPAFAKSVGYDKKLKEYEVQRRESGRDPLLDEQSGYVFWFFNPNTSKDTGLADPRPKEMQDMNADKQGALLTAKYQVQQVRTLLGEYDALILEADEFLNVFNNTVTEYEETFARSGITLVRTASEQEETEKSGKNSLADYIKQAADIVGTFLNGNQNRRGDDAAKTEQERKNTQMRYVAKFVALRENNIEVRRRFRDNYRREGQRGDVSDETRRVLDGIN